MNHLYQCLYQIRKQVLIFGISILTVYCSSQAYAATQGSVGANSSATTDIRVVIGRLALIFGLNDINLGSWSGSGDLSGDDNICVAVNGFVGQTLNYQMLAAGDGIPSDLNAFSLSNGIDQIQYRVFLTDDFGQRRELTGGQVLSGNQFLADNALRFAIIFNNCFAGASDANIEVLVEESELQNASGGVYNGTLTLTLIPE